MNISADPCLWNSQKREAIHFIQRGLGVAGTVTAAEIGIHNDVLDNFNAYTPAESLKEILVQQPSTHKLGVKGGKITEISVICAELDPRKGLQPHGEKTAADASAGRRSGGICAGLIALQGTEDRKNPLVRDSILKERKRPVVLVRCRRRACRSSGRVRNGFKALAEASRAGIADSFIAATF